MNKLCNDNWFEILLFLNYDDIQNLRKSRLIDNISNKDYSKYIYTEESK